MRSTASSPTTRSREEACSRASDLLARHPVAQQARNALLA